MWVKGKLKQILNIDPDKITPETVEKLSERLKELKKEHAEAILVDARKDYSQRSKTGYALDGSENDKDEDFKQVRGSFEDDNFVKKLRDNSKS